MSAVESGPVSLTTSTEWPPLTSDAAVGGGPGAGSRRWRPRSCWSFEEVTKVYPAQPPVVALAGVSFRIRRGELVAIVGPSGSGKSTLLHVVGTLERPTSGAVLITGLDVAGLSDRELSVVRATRIGFVFQQFFLSEHQTALDNVADGLLCAGVLRLACACEHAGGGARAGRELRKAQRARALGPTKMSGGERQRVAIARALVGAPAIVLADEPTGNLDSSNGAAIFALLEELHAAGATIVVITHDHSLAARLPRQIEVLDGQIVNDTGTPYRAGAADPRYALDPAGEPPPTPGGRPER